MIQLRAQNALERRMDLREHAPQAIADPGDLRHQIVVEAAQQHQFGERVVRQPQSAQCGDIDRTASAMIAASRASVLASPAWTSALRRMASPGRCATAIPSARATTIGSAPIDAG